MARIAFFFLLFSRDGHFAPIAPKDSTAPMADIENLNKFRKARAKIEAEREATENRVKFGRTKAQRNAEKAEKAREDRSFDHLRLTPREKDE